ncbi:MAG: SIMPL domain-containing protein [Ancrocorticia sp.]
MSTVVITVRGQAESRSAPEIATIHVSVEFDGTDRAEVMERALRLGEVVRGEIEQLADDGTVSEWSSDQLTVWSSRPWSSDGEQLPLVHTASLALRVVFADLYKLSGWVSAIAEREGVKIGGITWDLMPATRKRIEHETAGQAVADAIERASTYAAAVGRRGVTPVQIADVGLLQGSPAEPVAALMARSTAYSDGSDLRFRPEPVVVSAAVEMRFEAE